jgi:flagellar hook-length control protein FliK
MEEFPIHPLLNLSARESAEPRPARPDEGRGFERELYRAANASTPARAEKPRPPSSQSPADDAAVSDESSEQQHEHKGESNPEVSAPAVAQPSVAPPPQQVTEQPIDTIDLTIAPVDSAVVESETSTASNMPTETAEEAIAVEISDNAVTTVRQRASDSIAFHSMPVAADVPTVVPKEKQFPSVATDSEGSSLPPLATVDQLETVKLGDVSRKPDSLEPSPYESNSIQRANQTVPVEEYDVVPSPDATVSVSAMQIAHATDTTSKRGESRDAAQEPEKSTVDPLNPTLRPTLQLEIPLAERQSSEAVPTTDAAAPQEVEAAETSKNDSPVTRGSDTSGLLHRTAANRVSVASRSEHASSDGELHIDTTRFVGRVAGAFRVAQDRGGVLQLRLSPPELGSIKLELLVERGALTARIEAETSLARKVLLDNLPALRDRLAQQEIRVERFDVDVRQDRAGAQPDWQGRERNEHRPSEPSRYHTPRRTASSAPASQQILSSPVPTTDGRLNVLA